MQVKEIMTPDPTYCARTTSLRDVARMMVTHDCGAVPVVDTFDNQQLVGIVTDRDIVCRTLGNARDPLEMTAGDCMSTPVVTVYPEMSVEECATIMRRNQVRRVPVIDRGGRCCGMVAQADLATHLPEEKAAEIVKEISQPTHSASALV
jgi:CBS domain-containing protein